MHAGREDRDRRRRLDPDLLLRLEVPGLAEAAGLRRQHQAHPPRALDGARAHSAADARPPRASAGDRRADAADHRHAQLLHDAARAGRAVRPGAAAAARDPGATSQRAYHLDEPLWQQYLRYLGGVAARRLRALLPDQGLHVDRAAGEGCARQLQRRRAGACCWPSCLGILAGIVAALRQNSWPTTR